MKELFLLKLGEIVLKGQNRRVFEDKLKTVTRRRMAKFGEFKVNIVQSTLYVEPLTEDCDLDGAWEACGTIFGVAQMCRCRACEKNLDAMFNAVCEYLGDELSAAKSFKVESKRSDKRFPLNSIQISQEIGGRLAEEFPNVLVDVHNPDYTVNIEVRETAAYVHGPSVPGAGGLPTGTRGSPALRRHRFPGRGLHDRQARRGDRMHPLLLVPVHLGACQGKGSGAGAHHDEVLRPHDR